MALKQNSGLKSSKAATLSAAEDVTMAKTALLPSLKLKGFYTISDKSNNLTIDSNAFATGLPRQKTDLSLGDKDSYGFNLTLRQPLFTGGNLTNARQVTKHEYAAATHAYSRQRTLMLFQVKKTFNEALIASNRIQTAEMAVKAAEERLEVTVARLEEGYADREEKLRREADLAMANTRLIKVRNRSFLVLAKLRQLTGSGPGEEIEVIGHPAKLTLTGSLDDLTKGTFDRREDIKSATEKSIAAESGVLVARSGYLPQVFLEGNYLRQKETSIAHPELWSLTLQAEWSLFEWGRTSSAVRQAVARQSQLDLAREELERSAKLETEEVWREVVEQQSQVIAHEKIVRAEEAAFVKTIDRYLEGAARLDEVISAESALWEAYDVYCQSAANLSSAFAALEAATSAHLDQWTSTEDLYRPDFKFYASRIKSRTFTTPVKTEKQVTVTAQPEAKQTAVTTEHAALYLQLGAFLSRKSAEDLLALLTPRFGEKHTEILKEGKLYKPVIFPYSDSKAAEKAAADLGIKEYLIRSEHGPRQVSP